jgi:hypothetical protein
MGPSKWNATLSHTLMWQGIEAFRQVVDVFVRATVEQGGGAA